MLRGLVVATALLFLLSSSPTSLLPPSLLPLSDGQTSTLVTALRWLLAVCLVLEVNAGLGRWAERNWLWRDDKSVWNWPKEVAVVTGGSRGIGAAVAKKLATYGIRVAVLDVQPFSDDLENDKSNRIRFYRCDITSRQAVHEAGEAVRSDIGEPSILVNNAGIGNANSILDVTPQRLRAIFDINLLSHWNTVQEFLPAMIAKKKGHIMANASLAAFSAGAGMTDYSCTKAGVQAFHEGLTQELKHRYHAPQIKTSIVYPNWTRTKLTSYLNEQFQKAKTPVVEPEQVAEAMLKQIIAAKGGHVILGPTIAASIRALPTWIQELIRDSQAQMVTVNATSAVA
ncbi:hypothetical protein BDV96DRAFT_645732 [Lophiotrema nucula]|uniref:Short-chain dehydrogenase/reductase 3 n=1 Tax=Lophiotrema nucula TaxID=690887 RepID=A0A6A5ZAB3_9PLEO|nr:hypothetical protein BDV96DRAFT_645732 [Lophiotrema nucula]